MECRWLHEVGGTLSNGASGHAGKRRAAPRRQQETVVPEAARNPLEQPNEGLEPTAYSFGSAALHLRFRRRLRPGVRLAGCEGVVLLAPPQDHDKMSDQAEDWHERPTE